MLLRPASLTIVLKLLRPALGREPGVAEVYKLIPSSLSYSLIPIKV